MTPIFQSVAAATLLSVACAAQADPVRSRTNINLGFDCPPNLVEVNTAVPEVGKLFDVQVTMVGLQQEQTVAVILPVATTWAPLGTQMLTTPGGICPLIPSLTYTAISYAPVKVVSLLQGKANVEFFYPATSPQPAIGQQIFVQPVVVGFTSTVYLGPATVITFQAPS